MSPGVEVVSLGAGSAGAELRERVGTILSEGGLVALPTETVYGIAARADRSDALAALSALKHRPEREPLTWHVAGAEALERFPRVSPLARRLAQRYWPGPLTLVLPGVPAGLESVCRDGWCGVRAPAHSGTRSILAAVDFPVVCSSANLHGEPPLVDAEAVRARLGAGLALVVDGGPAPLAQASTVLRLGRGKFELLREGVLSIESLRAAAGMRIAFACTGNTCRSPMAEAMAKEILYQRLETRAERLADFGFEVVSMGVFAGVGSPAAAHAIEAMAEMGVDLGAHRSRAAAAEKLERFDRVYCLTQSHLEALRLRLPPGKDQNLRPLDPHGDGIADPIGGNLDDYRRCAREIREKLSLHADEWA
jgi:tRNA threonylcarbamoyl adenosine modification protein (Sua5/YciO/YrdC/YwlC family)